MRQTVRRKLITPRADSFETQRNPIKTVSAKIRAFAATTQAVAGKKQIQKIHGLRI
jgi:hypothetical protein